MGEEGRAGRDGGGDGPFALIGFGHGWVLVLVWWVGLVG